MLTGTRRACLQPAQRCAPRTAAAFAPLVPRAAWSRCQCNIRAQSGQQASAVATGALPASMQRIVGAFKMVPDPMARYKQLLYYANKLPAMAAEDHTPETKVEGCVSQVWVKPHVGDDGLISWTADSDSQLTKGLAALLVLGLSGCTAAEILRAQPGEFIVGVGLKQSLTPSRNNGFLNMFLKMQKLTLELVQSGQAQLEEAL